MYVFVRLIDHVGEVHGQTWTIDFEEQTTLRRLKQELQRLLYIPIDKQQLFMDGNELVDIDESLLKLNVSHKTELALKHAHVEKWSAVESFMRAFSNCQLSKDKEELAFQVITNAAELQDSGFFSSYPRFQGIYYNNARIYRRAADKTLPAMKFTAQLYFKKLYYEIQQETPKAIIFKEKTEGTRQGWKVVVDHQHGQTTYYLKTHHDAGSRENTQTRMGNPNLRELFIYNLLHLIGAGPKVHLPGHRETNRYAVYIATEEIRGLCEFQHLDFQKSEEPARRAVVQVFLLSIILGLNDCNSMNFGLDGNDEVSVFDFAPVNIDSQQNHVDRFLHQHDLSGLLTDPVNSMLAMVDENERRNIARESMTKWKIQTKIIQADGYLKSTKDEFKLLYETEFHAGTEDLDRLIQVIQKKSQDFMSL